MVMQRFWHNNTVSNISIQMIGGHTYMTSTKNDKFCDSTHPHHLQKLAIDLLLGNNRTSRHVTNFKKSLTISPGSVWT